MLLDGESLSAFLTIVTDVVFRLAEYDLERSLIYLEDGDACLPVDISLCLNGQQSYPWLRERNTVVMALGYLELSDGLSPVRD